MAYIPSSQFVPGALNGDMHAIARLLTRAETGTKESRAALDEIFRHAGRAHVVGITGVPGSGKSTLVAKLAAAIRATGRRIAIVAIDPSSPYSGGSILGDRIRMGDLAGDPGVYVRSMATRGAMGGLASGTLEAVDVLDAAGYDIVMIETVGVGQDEVDIARAAHTTVVVSAPGLGDDIQAIKAGILEIADVLVVNKSDREGADRSVRDLRSMLELRHVTASADAELAEVEIVQTSAVSGAGLDELVEAIERHRARVRRNPEARNRRRAETLLAEVLGERVRLAVAEALRARPDVVDKVAARTLDPYSAAAELARAIDLTRHV